MQTQYNAETLSQQHSERECDSAHDSDLDVLGTATNSETDFHCYWDMADTVSDYMSSFKQEERDTAVAAASRPVVWKVVLDLRYGKISLFALTDGIVFEYGLTREKWFAGFPSNPATQDQYLTAITDGLQLIPSGSLTT